MRKNVHINKSAANGRFVSKAIGYSKAAKFLAVEGMTLSPKSSQTLKDYKSAGLKGDALRAAIVGHFKDSKRA